MMKVWWGKGDKKNLEDSVSRMFSYGEKQERALYRFLSSLISEQLAVVFQIDSFAISGLN